MTLLVIVWLFYSVIIEIEVGNRSIIDMRRDFLHYFTDETLLAVVGMKFFGPGECAILCATTVIAMTVYYSTSFLCSDICPALRAVAVKWVRTNRGVEVADVRDFGVDPVSTNAMRVFAQDVDGVPGVMLPGVRPVRWAHNRHQPIATAQFDPVPEELTPNLCAQFIYAQDDDRLLYSAPSTVPMISFAGAALQNVLHNLPEGAQALDDFNLNLANVFFWVMKGAAYAE